MSDHYRTDDELRSITFRDEDRDFDYYRQSPAGPGDSGDRDYDRAFDPYQDDYPPAGGYGAGGPGGPGGPGVAPPAPRRRRSKTKTALLVLLSLVLMLGGGLMLAAYLVSENLLNQVTREDTFSNIPEEERAKKPTTGPGKDALNILLAGIDVRPEDKAGADDDDWTRGGKRSDTIMIVHITADRDSAYLISIPRDSWVEIPDRGMNKINAAYSFGGSELYVRTIERLTNLRIDHYSAIDMQGFKGLTDALGGVEMSFDEPVTLASGRTLDAGSARLTGEEALDYVRARKNLQDGDFDRIKRQQNFLRSLMRQALSADLLANPTGAVGAITSNLFVDEQFTNDKMRSLAFEMRNLRASKVEFLTVPLDQDNRTGTVEGQSVVNLDTEKLTSLFDAVREDKTAQWLSKNEADTLGKNVR